VVPKNGKKRKPYDISITEEEIVETKTVKKGKSIEKVNTESKLENSKTFKETMKKLEVCFTDDGGTMIDYYNSELRDPELKKYCLSSWTFCYICCTNEMANDNLGRKCCKERCDIKLNRILHVSIGCVKSHANMLKLNDYVPQYYKN